MKNKIKKLISAFLAGLTGIVFVSCGNGSPDTGGDITYNPYSEKLRIEDTRNLTDCEYSELNICGTDDYGRNICTVDTKENRYVGMFFFLTLGQEAGHTGIYDVSKITNGGKKLENFQVDNSRSPLYGVHFWGEPLWGYYNSADEWVIRKQIEMLTMAGVDFLVFDTSNAHLYNNVTQKVFKILGEYREQGWNVPKVMYYLGNNDAYYGCMQELWTNYYGSDTYNDLWFAPNGKPLITKPRNFKFDLTNPLQKAMSEKFEFKDVQWPDNSVFENGLPWMEWVYPQPLHGEWINVSTAQHVTIRMSDTVGSWGRGYDHKLCYNDDENFRKGINYEQEWETAISEKNKAKYVFVTGWNEWVAGKLKDSAGTYFMVDTFNEEFSRDIEPCKNGFGDNVYMQTIRNLRNYKCTQAKHYTYPQKTIDIKDFDSNQWDGIKSYRDFTGDCISRDYAAMAASHDDYIDNTNRNDIAGIQVCRDSANIYFKITAVDNITPYVNSDNKWMNLLIKTQSCGNNNYSGYNYIINRNPSTDGNTSVEKAVGVQTLSQTGNAEYSLKGKVMMIKVPLAVLKLSENDYSFEFKITDNIDYSKDYLDFYNTGDSAPIGRLNYSFGY